MVVACVNVKRFARKDRRDGEQLVAIGIHALLAYVEALSDGLVAFPALYVAAIGSACGGNVKHGAIFGFNDVGAAFNGPKRWFRTQAKLPVLRCFAVCCPDAHIGANLAAGNVYHLAGNRADDNEAGFSIGCGAACEIPSLSWRSVVLVDLDVRAVSGTGRVNVKCFSRVLRGNRVLGAAVFVGPFRLDYEALSARGVIFPALDVRAVVASACGNIKHGAVLGFNDVCAVFNGDIRKALVGLVAFIGGGAWLRISFGVCFGVGFGAACRARVCAFSRAVCAGRSTRSSAFSRCAARARTAFCGRSCRNGSASRSVVVRCCA